MVAVFVAVCGEDLKPAGHFMHPVVAPFPYQSAAHKLQLAPVKPKEVSHLQTAMPFVDVESTIRPPVLKFNAQSVHFIAVLSQYWSTMHCTTHFRRLLSHLVSGEQTRAFMLAVLAAHVHWALVFADPSRAAHSGKQACPSQY